MTQERKILAGLIGVCVLLAVVLAYGLTRPGPASSSANPPRPTYNPCGPDGVVKQGGLLSFEKHAGGMHLLVVQLGTAKYQVLANQQVFIDLGGWVVGTQIPFCELKVVGATRADGETPAAGFRTHYRYAIFQEEFTRFKEESREQP